MQKRRANMRRMLRRHSVDVLYCLQMLYYFEQICLLFSGLDRQTVFQVN